MDDLELRWTVGARNKYTTEALKEFFGSTYWGYASDHENSYQRLKITRSDCRSRRLPSITIGSAEDVGWQMEGIREQDPFPKTHVPSLTESSLPVEKCCKITAVPPVYPTEDDVFSSLIGFCFERLHPDAEFEVSLVPCPLSRLSSNGAVTPSRLNSKMVPSE